MTDTPDITALAAEYVLGLLDRLDAAEVEARLPRDPALRTAVAYWRERFAAIDESAVPVAPSPGLWPRIETSIAAPLPRPRPVQAAPSSLLARTWRSLPLWRGVAGALAAAIALLIATGTQPRTPVVIAVLLAPDGSGAGAIVEAYADGSIDLLPIADIPVPEGKTLQVWTLWDRARGPVPLGLMPAASRVQMAAASLPVPVPEQIYEITLEPAAGSPTGKPTGPILYKGLAATPR